MLGRGSILELRSVHVGGLVHAEEELQMTSSAPGFVGAMQQFTLNGRPYFELARAAGGGGGLAGQSPRVRVTAQFGKLDPQLVHNPVTFRSMHTFVGLPVLKAYSATNIYFQVLPLLNVDS